MLMFLLCQLVPVELKQNQTFQTLSFLLEEARQLFHLTEEPLLPEAVSKLELAVEVLCELIGFGNHLFELLEM